MATHSNPSAIPSDIAKLTGPVLLGDFFNWGLFGVLSVQTYIYYIAFPRDRLLPKLIVWSLFVLELLQTILVTRDAFNNFGIQYGNVVDLDNIALVWFSVPVLTAMISCTVQLFFAWRIVMFSRRTWISCIVVILSLGQCGMGIWVGVAALDIGHFSGLSRINVPLSVWLGVMTLTDMIISVTMTYCLSRSRSGFRATNVMVTRCIRVILETDILCAIFSIMHMVFFITTADTTNYHLAPSMALSKLYSNSVLALLNTRVRIIGGREMGPLTDDTSLSYTSSTENSSIKLPRLPVHRPKNPVTVQIDITHETTSNRDDIVPDETSEHKFSKDSLTDTNMESEGNVNVPV